MTYTLSTEATAELTEQQRYVDHYDEAKVVSMAEQALTRPTEAGFWDDDLCTTHTLMFHTPDWSLTDEYLMDQANYRTALAELTGAYPDDVEDASVGHWTYSRFQCIKVRVLDDMGQIHPAFVNACALAVYIQNDYPILDESLYSELEQEVWDSSYELALHYANLELEDGVATYLVQLVGETYGGQGEPGYVSHEWLIELAPQATANMIHDLAEAQGQVELTIPQVEK